MAARTTLLRAQPRPLGGSLELVVFHVLLAQTVEADRVRRAIRFVLLERIEERGLRAEIARAAPHVPKVHTWRGDRGGPAVD